MEIIKYGSIPAEKKLQEFIFDCPSCGTIFKCSLLELRTRMYTGSSVLLGADCPLDGCSNVTYSFVDEL